MTIDDKVEKAIKLLRTYKGREPIEVCYSGGKDSDVILQLAKMAGIPYRAIYKNTTIDPPHTIAHCKSNGVEILRPKETFFALVRRKGLPTRRARFCCEVLKEYKVLDNAIQGIRMCESTARAKRYKEPVICRLYGAKKNHVNVFLPILEWTDDDVEQFIAKQKIQCHPLYYDENGAFHVERRLGCIGCPLKSDNGKADFLMYPKFLKTLADNCVIWMRNNPQLKSIKNFGDAYGLIYHNLFCNSYADYLYRTQTNLWGKKLDCKEYLERYFNITL